MKDPVLIKSNKYGITIYFDPDMPYEELLPEVKEKFESSAHFFNHADMAVEFALGFFHDIFEHLALQRIGGQILHQRQNVSRILCIIEKNTYTERLHKRMLDESLETIHERDGQFYKGTLRGRQVLESEKSIVIVGDVEEGAKVISKGNVVVTGTIYGTVVAGAAGDCDAVIAALHMRPTKLRIGDNEVKPVIGGSYSWAKLS